MGGEIIGVMIKRGLPLLIAVGSGLAVLVSLLIGKTAVAQYLLNWVSFLTAVALLLGIVNLLGVHVSRLIRQANLYSGVLCLSLTFVLLVGFFGDLSPKQTIDLPKIFALIQAPLEAALASLLAFFLIYAGFRLMRHHPNRWSFLFLLTAVVMLLTGALVSLNLPAIVGAWAGRIYENLNLMLVTAGTRGLLIGVALGTATFSLRILLGWERPYNK